MTPLVDQMPIGDARFRLVMRYALALGIVAFSLALLQALEARVQFAAFSLVLGSLLGIRWLGGHGPTILCLLIAVPAFDYLVVDPVGEVSLPSALGLLVQMGGILALTVNAPPRVLQRLRRLFGHSQAASAPSPESPLSGPLLALTPREREVAQLIARGFSNRQIAEALVISEGTARSHVAHILARLGARSRTQVAAWVVADSPGMPGKR
jgi:DNA-binding CsgD family transcriptional regulator